MKTVLAPIDFSDVSRCVIDQAIVMARALSARLVLLNVVQLPALLNTGVTESDLPAGFCAEAVKQATTRLAALQRQLRDEGVTAHAIHKVGDPGEQIVEQAERLEADCIVMGSHGHSALYDLFIGSTTMRVLKQAPCSLAIVPRARDTVRDSSITAEQRQPVQV